MNEEISNYPAVIPWWKRSMKTFKGIKQADNIQARKRAVKKSVADRMAQRFAERIV